MRRTAAVALAWLASLCGVAFANPGVEPDPGLPVNYGEPFAAPTETNVGTLLPGLGGIGVFQRAFFAITNTELENTAGATYLTVVGENDDFVEILGASIDEPTKIERTVDEQKLVQKKSVTISIRAGAIADPPAEAGVEGCTAKAKTQALDEETLDYKKGFFTVQCSQEAIDFSPLTPAQKELIQSLLGTRADGTGFVARFRIRREVPAGQDNPLLTPF